MNMKKKFYNIILNNKGSVFIYVLVIFLLMSIIATTLIFSTVASYKIGLGKSGRNTSFYINDGAIEEMLTEIEEVTHRAEVNAISVINNDDSEFWKSDEWIEFENWIDNKLSLGEISVDQSVDYSEKALKKEFDKQFFMEILEDPVLDSDYTLIDDENNFVEEEDFVINSGGLDGSYVTNLESVEFTPANFDEFEDIDKPTLDIRSNSYSDNKITLIVRTDGTYHRYNKKIEMSVDIYPPKYNYAFKSVIKRKRVYVNQMASNAITAIGDVNIFGGSVVLNGNLYSYGTFPEKPIYTTFEKGGVVVGYEHNTGDYLDLTEEMSIFNSHLSDIEKSGDLTVNGDIYARSNVKMFKNGSNIAVSGNLYADGFTVEKNSSNGTVSIGKNMYLMDDLFVNGTDTSMQIGIVPGTDGELWTFLDGITPKESGETSNSNLSGSIRVSRDVSGSTIALNNLFISGMVQVGITREINGETNYYKTGESLTAENNFYFYQSKLADQESTTNLFEYKDSNGNSYFVVESIDEDGGIQKNPKYKVDHFLTMVRRGIEETKTEANPAGTNPVPEADRNIMTITSIEADDSNMDQNYALGVFLGNDKVYNPIFTMDLNDFITAQEIAVEDTDLKINAFQTRDYKDSVNEDGKIDEFIDFNQSITTDVSNPMRTLIFDVDLDDDDLDDDYVDVYINFPSSYSNSIPADAISLSNVYNMQGIIATKGNVFIYNSKLDEDFTFTGTIIAGGSISFAGIGKKIINQSNDVIYGMIVSDDNLIKAFHSEEGRKAVIEPSTRSIWGNLKINVTTNSEEIEFSEKGIPEQIGTSKDEDVKSYEVIYWKEL